jgi:hypothetical protein
VVIDDDNLRWYGRHAREGKGRDGGPLFFAPVYM